MTWPGGGARAVCFSAAAFALLACEPRKVPPDAPRAECKLTDTGGAWVSLGAGAGLAAAAVSVAADDRAPGVILAGTLDGLYRSGDCAVTFARVDGPRGVVNAVAAGADAAAALASAGGVWSSPSDGAPFSLVAQSAPVDDGVSLADDGARLFAASSAGLAVLDEGGWQLVDPAAGASCVAAARGGDGSAPFRCAPGQQRAVFAPSDASVLYVVEGSGVRRSDDGGATFGALVSVADPSGVITGLAVDAGDPLRVYVTTSVPPAVFVSADGGDTFAQGPRVDELSPAPDANPVAADDTAPGVAVVRESRALLRTEDGGDTWDETTAAPSPGAGVIDVGAAHVAFTVATGVVVDGGAVDLGDRAVALSHDGATFFVATASQMWRLDGGSLDAAPLGDLPRGLVTDVAASPADGALRAARRSGLDSSFDDGATWSAALVDVGTPGGDLAASAAGTLSANGPGGAFFLEGDGVSARLGTSRVLRAAALPSSRTAWLVTDGSLTFSLDGGDTFGAPFALPDGARADGPAALDGDALAVIVDGADGPAVAVVDDVGDVSSRAPALPCSPASVAVARSGGTSAIFAAGGDCGLVMFGARTRRLRAPATAQRTPWSTRRAGRCRRRRARFRSRPRR